MIDNIKHYETDAIIRLGSERYIKIEDTAAE